MTGKEAVSYIHSVSWMGSRPGLERIRKLLSLMGDPQKGQRFIHVAGTNGKGSTCAMLAEILKYNDFKTGLFTSPYVLEFNERIRVNGENISDEALGEITEYVKAFAEQMEDKPTEFELLTAIAFEHFKREECRYVVLETGLGGRLDSTNVIEDPVVSVITGIALDHTSVLGDTVEKIAYEKSGIIKKGCPVVLGEMPDEARAVIEDCAAKMDVPVHRVNMDEMRFWCTTLARTDFVYKNSAFYLGLLGEHQLHNAMLALKVCDVMTDMGITVHVHPRKMGLAEVRWPARFEMLSKDPIVIFDGAHNPQGISTAVYNIKKYFGRKKLVLLMGVMEDKDHGVMTDVLREIASCVHTVTPANPRAMKAEALAEEFSAAGVPAVPHADFDGAVAAALADAREQDAPVFALGSLYMYADVVKALSKLS